MTLDLNRKQLITLILALDAYKKILETDEVDPGPSQMDAQYVQHLAKTLREKLPPKDR